MGIIIMVSSDAKALKPPAAPDVPPFGEQFIMHSDYQSNCDVTRMCVIE